MFGKRRRMHKKKVGKKLQMEKMLNRLKKKEAENNMILKKEESFAVNKESLGCAVDCNVSVGERIESSSSHMKENEENLDPLEVPFLLESEKKKNQFSPQRRVIKRVRPEVNTSARRSGRKWPVRNGTSNLVSWLNAAEEIFDSPERQSKRSFDNPLALPEDSGPIKQPKKRAKSAHEILHFHPSDFEEPMDISPATIESTPGALSKNKRSRKVALCSSLTSNERSCFGEDAPVDSRPKKRAKSVSADVWDLHNKCTPTTSSNDSDLQASSTQSAILQDDAISSEEQKSKMNVDLPCNKSEEGIDSMYEKLSEAATHCNTVQVSTSVPITTVSSVQREIPTSSSLEIPRASEPGNSVCLSALIMPPDEGVTCREKGILTTVEQVECVINRAVVTDNSTHLELLTTTEQKLLFPMQDVPCLLTDSIKSTLKESEESVHRANKTAVESDALEVKETSAPDPFTEIPASEKSSPLKCNNKFSFSPVKVKEMSSRLTANNERKKKSLRSTQNVSPLSSTPVEGNIAPDSSFKAVSNRKLLGDLDCKVLPDQQIMQANEHGTTSKSDPSNEDVGAGECAVAAAAAAAVAAVAGARRKPAAARRGGAKEGPGPGPGPGPGAGPGAGAGTRLARAGGGGGGRPRLLVTLRWGALLAPLLRLFRLIVWLGKKLYEVAGSSELKVRWGHGLQSLATWARAVHGAPASESAVAVAASAAASEASAPVRAVAAAAAAAAQEAGGGDGGGCRCGCAELAKRVAALEDEVRRWGARWEALQQQAARPALAPGPCPGAAPPPPPGRGAAEGASAGKRERSAKGPGGPAAPARPTITVEDLRRVQLRKTATLEPLEKRPSTLPPPLVSLEQLRGVRLRPSHQRAGSHSRAATPHRAAAAAAARRRTPDSPSREMTPRSQVLTSLDTNVKVKRNCAEICKDNSKDSPNTSCSRTPKRSRSGTFIE